MRTDIAWAELHAPLFLAGTNLGQKLDPTKRVGLSMAYDEVKRHLYVTYNDRTARIPETSVLSMVEFLPRQTPKIAVNVGVAVFAQSPAAIEPPHSFSASMAQVETPTSHVFAGQGAGQTGQEPPRPRGRPPKGKV